MAKRKKGRIIVTLLILGIALICGSIVYKKLFKPVSFKDRNYMYLYIGRNDDFEDVVDKLSSEGVIEEQSTFRWLAEKMDLDSNIHPGKFRITSGMTMRKIINLLKYNKQEKVKLTFNSQIHDIDEFIIYVDEKLELDSDEIEDFLTDEKRLEEDFGLDPGNSLGLVIPGTYEIGWAVSPEEFFQMLREKYQKVWNSVRRSKAATIGFTEPEVLAIASIVQSESSIQSEQRKIAGVYINRLRKGMPLQADPTLKFAHRNYDAQRIYDKHKEINSPYNTYKFKGLPPGPICLVSTQAIDATLNYEKHNYIFFCARPDMSGYSNFSASYSEHQKHARTYQKALDNLGIHR